LGQNRKNCREKTYNSEKISIAEQLLEIHATIEENYCLEEI